MISMACCAVRRISSRRIVGPSPATLIRRLEIRRTPQQAIEIIIAPPRPATAFTAAELKAFFR